MRVNVPTVKIGGKKITPYSINFTNGGSTAPSTISVKYVNRSGRYSWPDLSSKSLITITIGDFIKFNGYAVEAEMSQDSSGSFISATYVDDSIILDDSFVGLKGVHGPGFETEALTGSTYRNMILVGQQVDPCQGLEETHTDPCAPDSTSDSAAEDNLKKQIDCAEQRLVKILDVVYSFSELLNKLTALGIKIPVMPAEKTDYFARHTGSLREVLNAWCQEYGITFFWENGIHFVDLKKGITINDSIINNACKIIDKRQTKSILGNYGQANINYFGLDGQVKEYSSKLNGGTRLTLLPITLSDIFKDQATNTLNPFIKKYYGTLEVLQKCCILSKYSPQFRDLYLMYHIYNVRERADADERKNMPLLGLEIKNTYTTEGTDRAFITVFLNQLVPLLLGPDTPTKYAARCFYNEEVHQKFIDMEKYLANEFMGKYWIRPFNKRDYSFSAPGASVEFIPDPTSANFDFANKIPKTVLKVNKFLRNLFDDSGNPDDSNFFRGGLVKVERQSPWQPEGSEIQFLSTSDSLQKEHFNNINDIVPDVPGGELGGVWPDQYSFKAVGDRQPVVKVFSEYFGELDLENISTGDHPLESDNVNIPVTLGDYNSTYGLVSSICRAYQIKLLGNKVFIYLPVQSHDDYGNQFPGFIVTAEKGGNLDYKILVNKIQRVLSDFPLSNINSVGMRVNFRDATQYINKVLEATTNSCQYNEAEIESLLGDFSAKFSFPAPVVQQRISYSIAGAPLSNISLEDGLSSLSMSLDGSGGVITQVEFANIPKTTLSDSIRIKDFERLANANYNKSFFSSDNKEIIS